MKQIGEITAEISKLGISRVKYNLENTEKAYEYYIKIGQELLDKKDIKMTPGPIMDEIEFFINWSYTIEGKDIDFNKGFLLKGPTGRGKTFLFRIWYYFVMIDELRYKWNDQVRLLKPNIINVKRISGEYQDPDTGGYRVIDKYSKMNCLVLDDIGTEPEISKSYGNTINVIEEIINLREENNMLTFGTSNVPKLKDVYDDRTISRMNYLFQTIGVNHDKDFRTL